MIYLLNYLGTYQATPSIPGMPTIPVLPTVLPTSGTNSYEAAAPSGPINVPRQQTEQDFVQGASIVINVPGLQREQNPVYSAMAAGFNMPQSHVVTTPISLPGMPPITVSASLPQNTSLYPSVIQQQNQFSSGISTTTVAPTLTSSTSMQ